MNRMSNRFAAGLVMMFLASAAVHAAEPAKTADKAILNIAQAVSENKAGPLWEALPSSYQKDVTTLVHTAIGKVDAEFYDQAMGTYKKIAAVLKKQKKFFLANESLAALNTDGALEKNWDSIVGFLETISESELSSHKTAKAIDLGKFAEKTGSSVLTQFSALMKLGAASSPEVKEGLDTLEKLKKLKATLVSESGDSATVRLEVPDETPEEVMFVRVDGKWIPKDLADNWKDSIAQANEAVAGITAEQMAQLKGNAGPMFLIIGSVADALGMAKTQEEFDATLNGLTQLLGGLQ